MPMDGLFDCGSKAVASIAKELRKDGISTMHCTVTK